MESQRPKSLNCLGWGNTEKKTEMKKKKKYFLMECINRTLIIINLQYMSSHLQLQTKLMKSNNKECQRVNRKCQTQSHFVIQLHSQIMFS